MTMHTDAIDITDTGTESDNLLRFLFQHADVRGQIVHLTDTWRDVATRNQDLPPAVLTLLGELTAAATLLASSLKFDGSLVMQLHGDDAVQLMVIEADSRLTVRAAVAISETIPFNHEARGAEQILNRHGRGRFSLILDPNKREQGQQPYQGVVPLQGGSIAAMLESYMARSEQIPTRLWLQANDNHAAGLLLQKLPDHGGKDVSTPGRARSEAEIDPDHWPRIQHFADTLKPTELVDNPPEVILRRLFWDDQMASLESQNWRFACRCSREKVAAMLRMLGAVEIESVLAERGQVDVRCQYCNQQYVFDPVDCARALLDQDSDSSEGSPTRH